MSQEVIPGFKLWLSLPGCEGVFGDGKWRLLKAIDEKGSLNAAAQYLGISYRKAWGDLKKTEALVPFRLIERFRGGSSGGGTMLTTEGRRWMRAYEAFHANIEIKVQNEFQKMMRELKQIEHPENEIL